MARLTSAAAQQRSIGLQVHIDILLKRLRRAGHDVRSVRSGSGQPSTQWTVGDVILNGVSELTTYARGVGALRPDDVIGSRQLRPDERKRAKETTADEDAARTAERFAAALMGLVFDLSFETQSELLREAVRVAPILADTLPFNRWRTQHADRRAVDFLGL